MLASFGRAPDEEGPAMVRLLAVCVLVTSGLGQAGPGRPPSRYPGARRLCSEHVSGAAMHISWESYATADSPDSVVAHYQRTTGRTATARTDGSRHFEWDTAHTMSIYPAARNDEFPHCDVKPTARERAIILSSTAARP